MKKNLYYFTMFKKLFTLLSVMLLLSSNSFGQWAVYNGSIFPNEMEPAFMTASAAFSENENAIIDDPDMEGNKLLWMDVVGNPNNQFLWRMNFLTHEIELEELTVVMRIKGRPDRDMALDIDMDFNGLRSRVSVLNGEVPEARIRNGSGDPAFLEVDVLDWTIYRFTTKAGETSLFINEDPTPVMVFAPATGSNRHFRFGDGDSGRTFGADIDWIIWDTTGTYAPGEGTPIPAELLPQEPVEEDWFVFDASALPAENDPAFITSGLAGAGMVTELVADPDDAENSLLKLLTLENSDNGSWRHVYPEPVTDVTVIMRVKSADDNGRRVVELDLENGGLRERLYINQEDNLVRLQHSADFGANNEFPLPENAPVKEWNIYRLTKNAEGHVKLYVNENPVPLAEGITGQTTSNNHFRFGDTNSSHNVSALIDWIIWDTTGTYAPGEGKPIPEGLNTTFFVPEVPEPHNWRIYDANVFPHEQIPVFTASSGSFNESENEIMADPDLEGNSLLRMDVSGNPQNQFLWRQNFATQGIEFEELTVVMRVKGNAERDMIMDLDMHFNDKRSRISIHNETKLARIRNGVGENVELTHDFASWNIYRFTMTATETRMYVNEDPEAVMVFEPAVAASANRHFRFGDGDSGNSMGADIDWVVWDYTGAYVPGEGDDIPSPVVTPNWDATLLSLMVDGALIDDFDAEVNEYYLVLPTGTTAVPQLSATASFAGANVEITQAEAIPGEAFVVVTAANGFTVASYKVTFRIESSDATLMDLMVGGAALEGFDPATLQYSIELPQGTTEAPEVSANATDENATVEITQAQTLPGEAIITVTAEDGTMQTYTIEFTLDSTSAHDPEEILMTVYPNPASDIININYQSAGENVQLRLINIYGQVVMHTPLSNTIDISSLNNGMYVLQLIDKGYTIEKMFIKQ